MIRHTPLRRAVALALTLVAAGLVSCRDDPLGAFEPQVRNLPDSFEFRAISLNRISLQLEYLWENASNVASVEQHSSVTAGSARLIILDAGGAEVFNLDLRFDGTLVTLPGEPGTWKIRVDVDGVRGTVEFRVLTT